MKSLAPYNFCINKPMMSSNSVFAKTTKCSPLTAISYCLHRKQCFDKHILWYRIWLTVLVRYKYQQSFLIRNSQILIINKYFYLFSVSGQHEGLQFQQRNHRPPASRNYAPCSERHAGQKWHTVLYSHRWWEILRIIIWHSINLIYFYKC